ncbi:MAG: hypothetical protein V4597_08480 [Pseudomonadota bacterium]
MPTYYVTAPPMVRRLLRAWSWLDGKVRAWGRRHERLHPVGPDGQPDYTKTTRWP